MKTARIIEVIRNTKELQYTRIGIAAYLAAEGVDEKARAECTADVQAWWVRQGGTVQD